MSTYVYTRPIEYARPYIIANTAKLVSKEGVLLNGQIIHPCVQKAYRWLLDIQRVNPPLFKYWIGRYYDSLPQGDAVQYYRKNINSYQSIQGPYGVDKHMYWHKQGLPFN